MVNIWKSQFSAASASEHAGPVTVGLSNGNFLVAWDDSSGAHDSTSGSDIIGRLFDPAGVAIGEPFQLNTVFNGDSETAPALAAMEDGGFVIVYHDNFSYSEDQSMQLRYERFDAAGAFVRSGTVATNAVGVDTVMEPVVTPLAGNAFLVTFYRGAIGPISSSYEPRGIVIDGSGGLAVSEFKAGATTAGSLGLDAALLSNGNVVVANWDIQYPAPPAVKLTIIDPDNGSTLVGPKSVAPGSASEYSPFVAALAGGGFAVVWAQGPAGGPGDTYFAIFDNDAEEVRAPELIATGTEPLDVVALADGGFMVSLEGELRQFDADGDAVGVPLPMIDASLGVTADGRLLTVADLGATTVQIATTILDPRAPGSTVTGTSKADGLTAPVGGGTVNGLGGADRLFGHDGNDTLDGGNGVDVVKGGLGADTIRDKDGQNGDTLDGQGGTDTLDLSGSSYASGIVTIDLAKGTITQQPDKTLRHGQELRERHRQQRRRDRRRQDRQERDRPRCGQRPASAWQRSHRRRCLPGRWRD